jgi:Ni2+-binding GTPase involved in maturation of urease and hydrogenase
MADDAAPMTAAPFVWRPDGRPDWRVMWESFCDLALHGGPPHRGADQALRAPSAADAAAGGDDTMVAEIRRGIWETTGLFAESTAPGWIAVTCHSAGMAAWLAGAIVLENVEARFEDDRLLIPAGPGYRLDNEVKSIVTVVAKTHHYWDAHLAVAPAATARSPRGIPRPLKIGIGGPAGGGKTALADALRRRVAGRLTVAAPSSAVAPDDDASIDLVLLERTTSDAAAFGLERVDATVGVLDLATAARQSADGGRAVTGWRLLVVSKIDTAALLGVNVRAVQQALRDRRGDQPVLVADLTAPDGADGVLRWLEHEMLLGL